LLKYIFIFIFLGGMLFTVVNYLPLIEEEVSYTKKGTAKKNVAGTEGSGEPEDGCEHGPENMINEYQKLDWTFAGTADQFYISSFDHYDYLSGSSCNPPPEV
jgi:hypothetical protein